MLAFMGNLGANKNKPQGSKPVGTKPQDGPVEPTNGPTPSNRPSGGPTRKATSGSSTSACTRNGKRAPGNGKGSRTLLLYIEHRKRLKPGRRVRQAYLYNCQGIRHSGAAKCGHPDMRDSRNIHKHVLNTALLYKAVARAVSHVKAPMREFV